MAFSQLAALASKQHGLMTRQQALDAGLNRMRLSRLVRSGVWQLVRPGVYRRAAATQTDEQALLAVCLWHGEGARVSHRSAARLHGLSLDRSDLEVTLPATSGGTLPGVILHRSSTHDDEKDHREVRRGIPVTSEARTLIDLASALSEEDLAFVVEEAWRKRIVSPDTVWRRLKELDVPLRGAATLSAILSDCRSRKVPLESALEVRVWRLLRGLELPRLVPSFEFRDDFGQPGRIDFAFPEQGLAIECDGFEFHGTREVFEADRVRTARLAALGWRVLPITWKQVSEQKRQVIARVRSALAFKTVAL